MDAGEILSRKTNDSRAKSNDTKHKSPKAVIPALTPASLDNSMNFETLDGIKLVFNFLNVPLCVLFATEMSKEIFFLNNPNG